MAGTITGGSKAAKTNKKRYGEEFYKINGAKGGRASGTGGYYEDPVRARAMGAIGGRRSRKGHKFISEEDGYMYHTKNSTGEIVKTKI